MVMPTNLEKWESTIKTMPSEWQEKVRYLVNLCRENDIDILQIKMKYGGLCFYVGGATEFVHNEIERIESECYDKKYIW